MPNNLVVSAEDKKRIARAAYQAIKKVVIADAAIAPLTTAAGLKALAIAPTTSADYYLNERRADTAATWDAAIGAGLFTDTNVAAANTNAGLLALCVAAGWDTDAASHVGAGDDWWN